MFHIVLYEPEIPPNTGNVMRLCANTGSSLHLIHPLGFELDDRRMRRAGLDYHEWAAVREHENFPAFLESVDHVRLFPVSTRGKLQYSAPGYCAGDAFLFGPETRGLPHEFLDSYGSEGTLRVPMQSGSRSLNLSNTVAVVVYEAWRQLGFRGSAR
jgi:tRNA (cytidine/uridine-2'-O-)-methyltransferase